ncbi:hypothetical protein [Candidatus Liberibacter sp.]|uniref:hypothetical protein n=1 Tax=Candidatus Liberibacter sp. TaxID=34022 RepID=UPI0015F6ED99|nr:hypothetical protein [Candidatus Liberibacter sp.]MBA5723849.1 hypothetical protein [Candidatus Liberibacter sp.]
MSTSARSKNIKKHTRNTNRYTHWNRATICGSNQMQIIFVAKNLKEVKTLLIEYLRPCRICGESRTTEYEEKKKETAKTNRNRELKKELALTRSR